MNIRRAGYYFSVWFHLSKNSFVSMLSQRKALIIFLTGKIFRFSVFIYFLHFLVQGTKTLAGYSSSEVILFFLCFNLVDVISQFLFREVYKFRPKVVSGDFDLTLSKPLNPLFTSLMGGADIIDFVTIPLLLFAFVSAAFTLNPSFFQIIIFIFLVLNAILIAAAFHIFVLSMAIITLEVDHTIMIYRDLTSFGRFPVDIYKQPLQAFLTFVIPVGLMMTVPVKVLIDVLSWQTIIISLAVGILFIFTALRFWNFALKRYASASS